MVRIVSFANKNSLGLMNFRNSVAAFSGWELDVIGKGVEWKGWETRMRSYMDYAAASDPGTILVFLDAFDVLCVRDADGFSDLFIAKDKRYIIGCQKVCLPASPSCKKPVLWQRAHGISGRFPNGGCVIGRARDIHYMWGWCIRRGLVEDDQVALGHFMDHHIEDVALDTGNEFVYNDLGAITARIDVSSDGVLSIDDLERLPFFIHYPALMLFRSVPLFSHHARPPHNYRIVAEAVLKDEALFQLESFPVVRHVYNVLTFIFFLLAVAAIVVVIRTSYKSKHIKKNGK